jgi:hypothetical protein
MKRVHSTSAESTAETPKHTTVNKQGPHIMHIYVCFNAWYVQYITVIVALEEVFLFV